MGKGMVLVDSVANVLHDLAQAEQGTGILQSGGGRAPRPEGRGKPHVDGVDLPSLIVAELHNALREVEALSAWPRDRGDVHQPVQDERDRP
jgi:hypothetical protein